MFFEYKLYNRKNHTETFTKLGRKQSGKTNLRFHIHIRNSVNFSHTLRYEKEYEVCIKMKIKYVQRTIFHRK